MKRLSTLVSALVIVSLLNLTNAQSDTTQVTLFSLVEQEITLRVGESCQLHVDPADADIKWMVDMSPMNGFVTIDKNGLVTALRPTSTNTIMGGVTNVGAESRDGSIQKLCKVTVLDQGSILRDKETFGPTAECEWKDASFSLTNDGVFKAEGAFYGSGAQPNYLNYIITDQCIFMWFEINYDDSTKMFYPQPFNLELDNCNAQEYNIYFNNRIKTIGSQSQFLYYRIARGLSNGGSTKVNSIDLQNKKGVIYNLKGQKLNAVPEKGIYIMDGVKYYSY